MTKVFVLVACQPGMVEETKRSLEALSREDSSMGFDAIDISVPPGAPYDFAVCLESEDQRLLVERISSLKNVSGVKETKELVVIR